MVKRLDTCTTGRKGRIYSKQSYLETWLKGLTYIQRGAKVESIPSKSIWKRGELLKLLKNAVSKLDIHHIAGQTLTQLNIHETRRFGIEIHQDHFLSTVRKTMSPNMHSAALMGHWCQT